MNSYFGFYQNDDHGREKLFLCFQNNINTKTLTNNVKYNRLITGLKPILPNSEIGEPLSPGFVLKSKSIITRIYL